MDTNAKFITQMGRAVWISDDPINVQDALDNGFDPNYNDRVGAVTLHRVAQNGCTKALAVFLKHDLTRLDLKDHCDRTPLHYTIQCSNFDKAKSICDQLLEAGFDIDAKSQDAEYPTPLFLCVRHKYFKLAAHLLERGANIDILNLCEFGILEQLIIDTGAYLDEEITEMLSIFLYYNVNINSPIMCHPIILAFHQIRLVVGLVEVLSEYLTDFDKNSFTNIMFRPELIIDRLVSMEDLNPSTIIRIIDKIIDANITSLLLSALPYTAGNRDLQIFNYLYFRLVGEVDNEPAQSIVLFFQLNIKLSKDDFMLAIEKLFAPDFGHVWRSESIFESLPYLFHELRSSLELSLDDLEIILCHMLQFVDYFPIYHLSRLFLRAENNFHLIMKLNPKVLDLTLYEQRILLKNTKFLRVCYPSVKEFIKYKENEVPHLWEVARDVIRQNISNETPEMSKVQPRYLFSYYNKVQKMNIPQLLKDIILLKQ